MIVAWPKINWNPINRDTDGNIKFETMQKIIFKHMQTKGGHEVNRAFLLEWLSQIIQT